ncbi:MAG: protease modulator HflC [Akkermansiaceae bacterium]|jgi:modulator of FtsH protease HflC|nr:protease modulator HflC [Akkermansiaceae bacterium]MBJ7285253.1 protease modulator HflC [Akkermansiaceae bacterium]MBJ7396335.1 protease modulator HflC [Akkermansiaceae bacterium]MBJ7424753.1 protease modulator HflC [Akkermansiaceae bacterium]
MKVTSIILSLFVLFVGILIFSSSAYTVDQTEQVFITEFGKPVGNPINSDPAVNEAGLHFKKPFIQQVNRIEKRILEWDGPATEMPTRDKLYISVDNFARWRISDPKTYFEKLRDERSALSRLDDIIGSETRNVIASHDLIEVIRSEKNRKPSRDETLTAANSNLGMLPPIQFGRNSLDQQILKAAQPKVRSWGIELLDVQFKRINYKPGVIDKIYARMASERQQIADRFRSEGAGEAAKIIGRKERDLLSIQSEAYRKEQEIKGKADAQATGIYALAYNSNSSAADFYQFVKTLDTYKKTLGKDTTTIFTSNSDLFRLFKQINPPTKP